MSVPVLPAIPPTPDWVYNHGIPYQFGLIEILPVVRIPVQGPAPFNTLAVVQSRAHITRWAWALSDLSRRSIPIGNGLRLARFDRDDPRQRQVRHSSSAVIRMMQISDEKDFPTDDHNTTFVLAVDRIQQQSSIDDYGQWSLTVDVADSMWQVYGAVYAEITSWVLCYEPPAAPGAPPDPGQSVNPQALQTPSLLAAYRDYARLPNADVLTAAAELTRLDRQLSQAGYSALGVDAEQTAIDILTGFTPPLDDELAYLIALAEARHNHLARLVEVGWIVDVPDLGRLAIDAYRRYAETSGADLWRAARDLAALPKPLLTAGDPSGALEAQQATLDMYESIQPAEDDRLEQLISVAEARQNLIARLIDTQQTDRAVALVSATIAAYQAYTSSPGADVERAVRDLDELATRVLAPAGLADGAAGAAQLRPGDA